MGERSRSPRERLAFALDVPDLAEATAWIARLRGEVGVFKIGLELFVRAGADAVRAARASGARVFLDLKLHDIPETVARAVRAAAAHEIDMLTVHAAGGPKMLAAAVDATRGVSRPPTLLAVTVLTSLGDAELRAIGLDGPAHVAVDRLAALALEAGVPGLVCSAQEVGALRVRHANALLVTPGIRPRGAGADDQTRTATAADAVRAGADLVVVGRPIREAVDPVAAARALVAEIASAAE